MRSATTIHDDGRGTEMRRETIPTSGPARSVCSWCGQAARFRYEVRHNGRRALLGAPAGQGRPFCSIGCFRTYCV